MTARHRSRWLPLSFLAVAAAFAACEDPTTPDIPEPGVITVQLVTPATDDRAMLVRIEGPDSATAVSGALDGVTVHVRQQGRVVRAAAFGPITSGALLRLTVPDARRASEYVATVVEVSDDANALRGELGSYRLTVMR